VNKRVLRKIARGWSEPADTRIDVRYVLEGGNEAYLFYITMYLSVCKLLVPKEGGPGGLVS